MPDDPRRLRLTLGVLGLLLLPTVSDADWESRYIEGYNRNLPEALEFLREYDREASGMCYRVMSSQWNFSTNITDPNKKRMLEEQLMYAKFHKVSWKKATSFAWKTFLDPLIRRQFKLLAVLGRAALPDDKLNEMQQLVAEMKDMYSKGKICPYNPLAAESETSLSSYISELRADCDLALEPELTRTLAYSRDYSEQLHVWRAWRDTVGRPMKSKFLRFIQLANEASHLNGFADAGEFWRASYDDSPNFEESISELWATVAPLYRQLHAYVRRRLMDRYGPDRVRPDGPIPAHLLGNMWAQNWKNVLDLTLPFPGKQAVDVTPEMLRQGYTPLRMFQVAEEFFVSLGLKSMPPEFWRHSMLEKPPDREVVCHASAWDFCNRKDYRIKQCTDVTMDDLLTIHHEMGHIQYYLQYADQPILFREGANPGFHEAVGDVLGLSVITPRHLHKIGLLNNITDDYETNINFLLSMALEKIAFLPFGYVVDKWRWNVFSGDWGPEEMNGRWWELRLKYQGIIPPIKRSEEDFDPGAKYHIPSNTPYIRYFVSTIVQFQFHKALCEAAGHYGPLHQCDIYRSREAGRLLSDVLALGSSKPWPEVMRVMTRGRTDKMDAQPLLEYFQPLALWLRVQNREERIGWSANLEDTALFAPWYQNSASREFVSTSAVITILFLTIRRLF